MNFHTRISTRLYIGFASVVGAIAVLGAIAFFAMASTVSRFHDYEERLGEATLLIAIQEDLIEARMAAFGWRATGQAHRADAVAENLGEVLRDAASLRAKDAAFADQISSDAQTYLEAFGRAVEHQDRRNRAFADYRDAATSMLGAAENDAEVLAAAAEAVFSAERFLLDNQAADSAAARAALQEVIASGSPASVQAASATLSALNGLESAINARNSVFTETLDRIGPLMLEITEAKADEVALASRDLRQRSIDTLISAEMAVVVVAIIAALLSGLGAWRIARSIVKPLGRALAHTEALVAKNYDQAIQDQDRHDEVGDLARALEAFRTKLQTTSELQAAQEAEQAEKLARSERLRDLIEKFDEAATEQFDDVGDYAENLRKSAADMSSSLDSSKEQVTVVAASSEESSASVQTVASSAEELNASIGEIKSVSDRVTHLAGDAANRADSAQGDLREMETAVQAMVGAIESINAVAEQTNLLALNATIEAARAGEAGKGFAVVASEVKMLANQAQSLNEEIGRKVADVQNRSHAVTGATTQVLDALGDIRQQAAEAASVVTQQAAAVHEIAGAANEAAVGTREAAAHVDTIRATAERTSDDARSVAGVGSDLEERIRNLRSLCRDFLHDVAAA